MCSLTDPGSEGCGTLHDLILARNGHYMLWTATHGLEFQFRGTSTAQALFMSPKSRPDKHRTEISKVCDFSSLHTHTRLVADHSPFAFVYADWKCSMGWSLREPSESVGSGRKTSRYGG